MTDLEFCKDSTDPTTINVDLNNYKCLVLAMVHELSAHGVSLGSIADNALLELGARLETESYCSKRGIPFEDLTPEDYEQMYFDSIVDY